MRFSYIFNQDEFTMLLALAGYKKLYGYRLENNIISADCAGYAFNLSLIHIQMCIRDRYGAFRAIGVSMGQLSKMIVAEAFT